MQKYLSRFVVLGVLGASFLAFSGSAAASTGATSCTVPTVTGDTNSAAVSALMKAHCGIGATTFVTSSTVKNGYAVSTAPAAGSVTAAGAPIDIILSLGPPAPSSCTVPNVAGEKLPIAEASLRAAGCLFTTTAVESTVVPTGWVISTAPTAGTSMPLGSKIAIMVSSGSPIGNGKPCVVPNVVSRGSVNAQNSLDRADCAVGSIFYLRSKTVPAGHVITTIPRASAKLKPEAKVDLVISLGTLPQPTALCQVPDLNSKSAKQAIGITQAVSALDNANCLVGTVTLALSRTVPVGKVISTSPGPGTVIRSGPPVVNIVESLGKPVKSHRVRSHRRGIRL